MADENDPSISYSVRDILNEISSKLDRALIVLSQKSDTSIVEALAKRVLAAEITISAIRARMDDDESRTKEGSEFRKWIIPTILTAIMAITTVVSLFHK